MWAAIISLLTVIIPDFLDLYKRQVAINEANARLDWAQALQTGLQPLEQGQETTDAQKLAAAKAVADAWAKMPSK